MNLSKIASLIIPLLAVLIFNTGCIEKSIPVFPKAKSGTIDLSQWDFDKNGSVTLEGEWDFYWNQFLSYEEIIEKKKKH